METVTLTQQESLWCHLVVQDCTISQCISWFNDGLYAIFRVEHNGAAICDAVADETEGGDMPATSCAAAVLLAEGKCISSNHN